MRFLITGGERGIRTLDRVSPIHAFQACAFNHSAISPVNDARDAEEGLQRRPQARERAGSCVNVARSRLSIMVSSCPILIKRLRLRRRRNSQVNEVESQHHLLMTLIAGTRLGPYEILAPIGAGGMGEVYKARDTRLDRIVAIKISAEQFSERFEREARAVAALNHPHICTLHDVGPNSLVMEYIDGPTLAERMAAGPIVLAEALAIARQMARRWRRRTKKASYIATSSRRM
jgi:hypothetical protein